MNDEIQKTYASGRAYMEAAMLIDDNQHSTGRDYLIPPTHTCLGLAVELLFKAVAMHQGVDERTLKSVSVRHDLAELRRLVKAGGFAYTAVAIDDLIDHINPNYSKHEYRYFHKAASLNRVAVEPSFRAISSLLDEVADYIGVARAPA